MKEIPVPIEIGICVDEVGFLGLLFLPVVREVEGSMEFLCLVKDPYSVSYRVEFHKNENSDGDTFHLHQVDTTSPGEMYYVTDKENPSIDLNKIESYVLYLNYEECVRFSVIKGSNLPEIKVERKKWGYYYQVVRGTPDR